MSIAIIRGDAARLPLPDGCADLIAGSPPFYQLRSYTDGGEHYAGQLGAEATPGEYLEALWACTAEWARVLKPSGSIFVELGDKYSERTHGPHRGNGTGRGRQGGNGGSQSRGPMEKSLLGLPWRYANGCVDRLGLILRRDIIWQHTSGLPESVTDRAASRHSYVFHLVKQPRYYAAVDEIRERHVRQPRPNEILQLPGGGFSGQRQIPGRSDYLGEPPKPTAFHSLGKLPGSVWKISDGEPAARTVLRAVAAGDLTVDEAERLITGPPGEPHGEVWDIPSAPLVTPRYVATGPGGREWPMTDKDAWQWARGARVFTSLLPRDDTRRELRTAPGHFAAYPFELVRRIVLGWSPPGICTACGEGRRPVSGVCRDVRRPGGILELGARGKRGNDERLSVGDVLATRMITGYACACTPHTDHPDRRGTSFLDHGEAASSGRTTNGSERNKAYREGRSGPSGPVREYHLDGWQAPPARPALVVDPFGGTGTTAVTASVLGRDAVTVDRSMDYCRLSAWRTTDPGERARAAQVPKPPPVPAAQGTLFD